MNDELLRDIEVLIDTLKQMTTSSDKSMNVAYADETALRPLKTILLNIAQNFQGFMSKETVKQQQEVAKVTEQLKKTTETVKKSAETQGKSDDNALKSLDRLEQEAKKTNSSLALLTRMGQALGKIVSDSAKQMSENSMKFARFAQDLTGAGVAIQDGGKGFRESLTDSANKIGLKTDEFVKMVSGNSQALARLSASGVNQMNYMTDAMAQYKTITGASKEDASAVWSYMADTILRFDTDTQIRNRNMGTESQILLKNFRDLSFATGKSVESLTKEMEARKKNYMEAMFQRARPELYNKIAATAMPEPVKEYALTGRQTPELMKLIGLNPEVGRLMAVFDRMRVDRSYDKISTEDYGKMINPIIDKIQANAQGFAPMGPYFANAYNETLMQSLEFGKIGKVPTIQESGEQLGFVDSLKDLRVSLSKLDNEKILAYSISLNKFEIATQAIGVTAEYTASKLRDLHNTFGDLASVMTNLAGSAATVASSMLANAASSGISSYIGAKLGAGGVSGAGGGALKLLARTGGIGALLWTIGSSVNEVYQMIKKGPAQRSLENQKDWSETDYINPAKWISLGVDKFIWRKTPKEELRELNFREKLAQTMDARRERFGDERLDETPASVETQPVVSESITPQISVEDLLSSINDKLARIMHQAEADSFDRKANRRQPNNMTD